MPDPSKPAVSKSKTSLSRAGLVLLVILAVATGVSLNKTAWRNRRLMLWQAQAVVIASGLGFVAGRLTARKGSDD